MNAVLLGILAYLLVQFGIGIYVSRRVRTESDYFVAGRRLGYKLATFTILATWFGAETTIGSAGAVYESGLSGATSDPFGYAGCLFLMGMVFAAPLWRRRLTTLADLFRERFSPGVEKLAVLLMVPTSLLWAAAQIRAFGQVLAASSGLDADLALAIAATIVIAYTAVGGMLADAWTDLVQGIVLILGLVVLFGVLFLETGLEPLRSLPPSALDPRLPGSSPLALVEEWAIPVFGSVVAAELVSRVISARNPEVARRSSLFAGTGYLMIGCIPVVGGLAGSVLLPGLDDPEQVLPLLAQRYLPSLLYVVFSGALISAILSTVDTTLLVCSSLVSHNVIVPAWPHMSEKTKLSVARTAVAAFGGLAYFIALRSEGVFALVEEASSFGSAGIFTVVTLGLFTQWGGAVAAAFSLIAGVFSWIIGAHILALELPYLTSLASALAAYALGATVAAGSRRPTLPST